MRGRNIEGYWRAAWMQNCRCIKGSGNSGSLNIDKYQRGTTSTSPMYCSLKCSASPEFAPLAFNHQIYPVRVYRLWLKMVLNSPVGMSRAFVLVVISILLQNKVHQSFRNLCVLLYSTYLQLKVPILILCQNKL